MVFASLLGTGTIIKNFENSHIIVTAYFTLFVVVGNGPIVSMVIVSNGRVGVSVICIGPFIECFGLLVWH